MRGHVPVPLVHRRPLISLASLDSFPPKGKLFAGAAPTDNNGPAPPQGRTVCAPAGGLIVGRDGPAYGSASAQIPSTAVTAPSTTVSR